MKMQQRARGCFKRGLRDLGGRIRLPDLMKNAWVPVIRSIRRYSLTTWHAAASTRPQATRPAGAAKNGRSTVQSVATELPSKKRSLVLPAARRLDARRCWRGLRPFSVILTSRGRRLPLRSDGLRHGLRLSSETAAESLGASVQPRRGSRAK
jgi:hypothetical protein